MKAILEFNLPEEQEDYERFNNSARFYDALCAIGDYLRSAYKYGSNRYGDKFTESEIETVCKIYDGFFEILKDEDVNLY